MAKFPALPLWTDAYLGDTSHLTTIEHGAYILLLIAAWRSKECCLPNDDKLLARYAHLTPGQWRRIKGVLMPFFYVQGDQLFQGRLTDEHTFVKQHSRKQSQNAKSRWLKTKKTSNAAAMPDRCQIDAPTPTPTPTPKNKNIYTENFLTFWKAYPSNVDKKRAFKAFSKVEKDNISLNTLLDGIKIYIKNKPDWQEYKNASTWLNGSNWEDEYNNKKYSGGKWTTL